MNILPLSVEIIVAVLGLLLLIVGLLFPDKGRRAIGIITGSGLIIALIYVVKTFSMQIWYFGGAYVVNAYSGFFKLLFIVAAILVILSGSAYINRLGRRLYEFYTFLIFALLGMIIMASSGELVTMYVGLELMTISFYILTAFLVKEEISVEAGLKYLILGAISSAILLFGISLVYAATGSTIIYEIRQTFQIQPALIAGVVLMIAGFGFKVALVPFHMWSPDIYQGAPTPVTAFLAVGSKAAAIAVLTRVFIVAFPNVVFGWGMIIAVLAAITILAGNLIALSQSNVKRMLAYSSIAQAGYIMVGLSAGNIYGVKGVLFYALLYVFSNMGAFAVVTVVEMETGSTDIEAFNGLSRRSLLLAGVMTICMLSLAGIPPLAGFVGKFYLFAGAVQSGYLWLAFIGLIMSMISIYYYLQVTRVMFTAPNEKTGPINMGISVELVLWACLLATITIGIYPAPLSGLAQTAIDLLL